MSKDHDTPIANNHCGIVLLSKSTLSPDEEVCSQNVAINIYVTIMRHTINEETL